MYDISTRYVKKGKIYYFIFLAVGLFFLIMIGGILVFNYLRFKNLDSTTTSTKVIVNSHMGEGSVLYSPTYYYKVNGREYSCSSYSSSSINPGTNNKTVYYDSKNPFNCMTEYSKSNNNIILIVLLLPLIFIIVGVVNIRKISKRVKRITELNQRGKLVKNLPYRLEDTNLSVNNIPIQRPVVEYTLSSGSTITLYGDPRYDRKNTDSDGMIDLVIDESDPNNYFIDFDINRLDGNLSSDYFNNISNYGPQKINQQADSNQGNNVQNNNL